jgi:hypothetical protein
MDNVTEQRNWRQASIGLLKVIGVAGAWHVRIGPDGISERLEAEGIGSLVFLAGVGSRGRGGDQRGHRGDGDCFHQLIVVDEAGE